MVMPSTHRLITALAMSLLMTPPLVADDAPAIVDNVGALPPDRFAVTELMPQKNAPPSSDRGRVAARVESSCFWQLEADTPALRLSFVANLYGQAVSLSVPLVFAAWWDDVVPLGDTPADTWRPVPEGEMMNLAWAPGAEHIIECHVQAGGYEFRPGDGQALVFKVTQERGYVYMCGTGTVTTAAGAMHELGSDLPFESWVDGLKADDPLTREAAAQALGWLGDRRAVAHLVAALADDSREVRRDAAEALARLREPSSVPALVRAVGSDAEAWVRHTAIWAIGEIGDPRAVQDVLELSRTEEPTDRSLSAETLGKLGGPEATDRLLELVADEDGTVRTYAARALAGTAGDQVETALVGCLVDAEASIRLAAATSLAAVAPARAATLLVARFPDETDVEVRKGLVEAIATAAGQEAIPQLRGLLEGELDDGVKEAIAVAIQKLEGSPD